MTPLRCIVVSPGHPDEVTDAEVAATPVKVPAGGTLLFIRLPATFELEYLDYVVDQLLGPRIAEADVVVVKCHRDVAEALADDQVVRTRLAQRFPDARRLLLWWSPTSALHELVDSDTLELASDIGPGLLPVLRDLDFGSGLHEPGATLPANPEFHYEGPNGLHYERFVRAGYALQSIDAMEGAAFWLLPYCQRLGVVVLDSWTLLGFGHVLANYAIREAPKRVRTTPLVTSAEEYGEGARLQQRLKNFAGTTGQTTNTMVITSVHSTGNTERTLREACTAAGLRVTRIVRLYANEQAGEGDPSTVVTMHLLSEPVMSSSPGACQSCLAKRKALVPVDRQSLLLALTAAVQETTISREAARSAREFMRSYRDTDAVRVHRTGPAGDRHHMVYIDVERLLLESTLFRERCEREVARLRGRVQVVTSPTHGAAVALGRLAAEVLGVRHVPCEQQAYGNLEAEDRAALFSAEGILFVDDVVITGTRIRRMKTSLMQARVVTNRKDADVFVLVGVARPGEAGAWQGVIDYSGPDNVLAVERLDLPNWDTDECPWCRELDLLRRHRAGHRLDPALADRLRRLEDVQAGLSDELFLAAAPRAGGSVHAISHQSPTQQEFDAARDALLRDYQVTRQYQFSELGQG